MDLWWDDQDYQSLLYVGCYELPTASIMKSNGGKWYSYLIELPIDTMSWKTYMEKEQLKLVIEKAVQNFFDLANTSRPAMESNE